MGEVKVKMGQEKEFYNKRTGETEMTSERSVGYLARMHGRCTENFGEQSEEERIRQIPELSARLLADVQKIAAQHDDYNNIPMLARLEVRQKISLGVQLELMSIF